MNRGSELLRRQEANNPIVAGPWLATAVTVAGRDVQPAIRAGYDVAQATELAFQQTLGSSYAVGIRRIEPHAQEVCAVEGRQEEIVVETASLRPFVECSPANCQCPR